MTVADDLATLLNRPDLSRREREACRDRVVAEIARLTDAASESKSGLVTRLMQRAEAAEAEAARLRDGLRFYADENHWTQMASWGGRIHDEESEAILDGGKKARALLAEDGAA